ncbi:unnamed protein product [Meganyctiphanes norvegica]|uniref:Uncharacterized protein n=1 Tax=Meganyctiphanes norvegica TaxID=48144 RepID=A0AAV2SFD5_MEGNR
MGENNQGAVDARSVSSQWLNYLENFEEYYVTLGTQLAEEQVEWQIHETAVLLKHWLGILPIQREEMHIKHLACPDGESKTNLAKHINDNHRYEIKIKARLSAAENFISLRRDRNRIEAERLAAPEGAGAVVRTGNHLTRLSMEPFDGDLTDYETWQTNTKSLLLGISDESIKVRRMKDCLTGRAKLYVGHTGAHLMTESSLWAHLDYRYKDKWAGNLELSNQILALLRNPLTSIGDLVEFHDKFRNLDLMAEQKNLTREFFSTSLFLAALPDTVRSDIVKAVTVDFPDKHLFLWSDLGKHTHRILEEIGKNHEMSDPIDHLVYSNFAHTARREIPKRGSVKLDQKSSNKGNNNNTCLFCGKFHKATYCYKFNTINARKNKLQETPNVCFSCLLSHKGAHRSFTTPSTCDSQAGKCCGASNHPKYLCPKLDLDT